MLGIPQSLAGVCDWGQCGEEGLSRVSPERAHRTPSLSVVSAQCWQRLLAPRAAVSGHKRRELEGLTCRCSVNVFIFFFEVFFAISEEDGSCHFDHWLLPPQSFPVPPSMTPGPAAELSPSPLSTGGSWAQRERIQLLARHGLLVLLEPLLSLPGLWWRRAGSTFSGGTCLTQEQRDTATPHCTLFSLPTSPCPEVGEGEEWGGVRGRGQLLGTHSRQDNRPRDLAQRPHRPCRGSGPVPVLRKCPTY